MFDHVCCCSTASTHCDHPGSSKIQISAIAGGHRGQLVSAICFPLLKAPREPMALEKNQPYMDHKYQSWWVDLGGYTKW